MLPKKILNKNWFLLEEYKNFPKLVLWDFVADRAKKTKNVTGHFLDSAILYNNQTAFTCFERKNFLQNKKIIFTKLIKNLNYFKNIYTKEKKLIGKLYQLNKLIISKNPAESLALLQKWHKLFLKIAFTGQAINVIEFDNAWLSNYLKSLIEHHVKKHSIKSNVNLIFSHLTKLNHNQSFFQKYKISKSASRYFEFAQSVLKAKKIRYHCYLDYKKTLEILAKKLSKQLNLPVVEILNLNFKQFLYLCSHKRIFPGVKYTPVSGTIFFNDNAFNLSKKEWGIIYKKIINFNNDTISQIKGQVAYPGIVQGKAVIINPGQDFKKAFKGCILVSHTTTADLMPALKKCSAIISDMGGITSHAAIVSRELGVPCIIGTKIATKVFKDGDMVEVDANKGIVRKIK